MESPKAITQTKDEDGDYIEEMFSALVEKWIYLDEAVQYLAVRFIEFDR